jgi:hypothetical protein
MSDRKLQASYGESAKSPPVQLCAVSFRRAECNQTPIYAQESKNEMLVKAIIRCDFGDEGDPMDFRANRLLLPISGISLIRPNRPCSVTLPTCR